MTDLIRSASLTHYAEIARTRALDPREMLQQAGFRCAASSARTCALRSPASAACWKPRPQPPASRNSRLRLAARGDFSTLGPVALVIREQATVGAAIEALARYIHIQDEAMRLEIAHRDELVTIVLHSARRASARDAAIDRTGAGPGPPLIISLLFSQGWRPLEVHFVACAATAPRLPPAVLRLRRDIQFRFRRDRVRRARPANGRYRRRIP